MTSPAPRPRWKKKRWVAALALWWVAAYLLSVGPAYHAAQRQWLPWPVFWTLYGAPTEAAADHLPEPVADTWWYYCGWWMVDDAASN